MFIYVAREAMEKDRIDGAALATMLAIFSHGAFFTAGPPYTYAEV